MTPISSDPQAGFRFRTALLAAGLALALAGAARADEGMWTLDNFPKQAVRQKYGVDVTDAWLDHVRLSSVRLEGGCSGSFVSPEGLVLTNHHCVNSCVQQLSTAERDLLAEGFLAKTPADEVRCDTLEVSVLVGTEDVSERVAAVAQGLSDSEANRAQKAEMTKIEKACEAAAEGGGDTFLCEVGDLYHGGQHWLYKYRRYRDVRLAFAPEIAIANFGGDPDNFNFPRYDLDMSLVRAYEDGKPAKTPQYLRWNAAGAQEGDAVFISGHPGTTNRLLTVDQLETLRDVVLPMRLLLAAELRGRLIQYGKTGPEPQRIIQEDLLGLENGIKVRKGQLQALLDEGLFGSKQADERALRAGIAADPAKQAAAGAAWDEVAKAEQVYRQIYPAYRMLEQGAGFASDLFTNARRLVRVAAEREKPNEDRLREYTESQMPTLEKENASTAPVYPDLEELTLSYSLEKLREWLGPDDPLVKEVLGKESPEDLARKLVRGSKLADPEVRKRLWAGGAKAIAASDDPMIQLALKVDDDARAVRQRYEDEVEAPEQSAAERIAKARFAAQGTSVYPDATFTLRMTYGAVKGWDERGKMVVPFTTFGGVFERATGKDPFALPPSWLESKPRLDAETRFNFVADTDIIGGNSGSPLIDKDGKLVGLAFDGNIHSIGGAYGFDPAQNRTVAVHAGGMLEALKKVYRADRLVQEIERAAGGK